MLNVVTVYLLVVIYGLASVVKLIYVVVKNFFMNRGKQNEKTDIL